MRVDNQLIRQMLEVVEGTPSAELMLMPNLPGYAADAQRHHLQLLFDEGYLTAQQLRRYGRPAAIGLTSAGQKLLESLRQPPTAVRSIGEVAGRVLTGIAVGVLAAKAKAIGL